MAGSEEPKLKRFKNSAPAVIRQNKGEPYVISPNLPAGYTLSLCVARTDVFALCGDDPSHGETGVAPFECSQQSGPETFS
jgi:hypothetical protein